MKSSIPSVLRLSAKASPCPMTTYSSSMASSTSYEHLHCYSMRASHRRPGRTIVAGITPDVWLTSLFSHVLFLQCDCWVVGEHCFEGVRRHDQASNLIEKSDVLRFYGGRKQAPYRTRERADTLVIWCFDVRCPPYPQGAHPCEGKRVHPSRSESLYPGDFTKLLLL